MKLVKKNIHRNHQKIHEITRIVINEDYNVPDSREDIDHVLLEKAHCKLESAVPANHHIRMKGELLVELLYQGVPNTQELHSLTGRLPIEETVGIEGLEGTDTVGVECEIEDLTVGVVNSRKLNIKAVILLHITVEELRDEEAVTDIEGEEGIQQKKKKIHMLQLKMHKKDNCRIKEEIQLPSGRANIYELLFSKILPQNIEIRKNDERIIVHGDLKVFLVYRSEAEDHPVEILDESVPFRGEVEGTTGMDTMIMYASWKLPICEVDVRADYDGEERNFAVDGSLELQISLFEEQEDEVISDVYSIRKQVVPVMGDFMYQRLLVRNQAQCRISDRILSNEDQNNSRQILFADGKIISEELEKTEAGIVASGVMEVCVLYLTGGKEPEYESRKGQIAFKQLIETVESAKESDCLVQMTVGQLSAAADGEGLEIKGVVDVNLLAVMQEKESAVKELEVSAMNYELLQEMPGITGYFVDEKTSLWDLAKKYCTTIDEIKRMNHLEKEEVEQQDKILIIKNVDVSMEG